MSPVRIWEAAPVKMCVPTLNQEMVQYLYMADCLCCKVSLESRWQVKYCSNFCQKAFQHQSFLKKWKAGTLKKEEVNTKNISKHIKKYLIDQHGQKCSVCGWDKRHPVSGVVPLDVDHIDGDSENNVENNLRLLCPNCHALTLNFKNRNRKHGRVWRRETYIKKGKANRL